MYLIIKDNDKKQMPIKAYNELNNATNYLEYYIKESNFYYRSNNAGYKHTKIYARNLQDGRTERLYIRYMRVY